MKTNRFGTLLLVPLVLLAALAVATAPLSAQATGRIAGRVVDAQTGAGLSNVTIEVVGTGLGALSGVDGRFMVNNVPAGAVSVRAQSIGYGQKTVTDVKVPAGGAVEQNISLDPAAVALSAIEVTAGAERGSVDRALDMQRTSTGIVNSVTAEQISRSPDGDAAAAMQRVSGVTVQDGKYIHVRGLGERYTTTSLNGARIPSPEPERKVVPLDLFPAGLLQSITTAKTFTPDQPGDFSGGQVDIRTREFPAGRQFTLSTGFGFNDRVTGSTMLSAPRTGTEWLARAGDQRALPQAVAEAGNFTGQISQQQYNQMINGFRNAWTPRRERGRGASSLGMSLGGTDGIFGQDVSYLLSGTYSYGEEVRADEVRARALAGDAGSVREIDRFNGSTGRTSVLTGGLVNASTVVGQHSRVFFNGTANRTSDNEARLELGSSENHGDIPMQIQRLRFVERSVYSAQFGAEHSAGRVLGDWSVTRSGVQRNEPDRSEFVYAQTVEGEPFRWFAASNEGAVRSFGSLTENSTEAAANLRYSFGSAASPSQLKVGGLLRRTSRDALSNGYSVSALQLPGTALQLTPEEIFDGRFTDDGHRYLRVTPLTQGGSYTAEDRLQAGYAMIDFAATDRIRIVGGARVEQSELDLVAQSTIGSEQYPANPRYTDVLPSLALNLGITETQNLRVSVSRTLARPEYRELSNVQYREVLGGENVVGNPELRRTLIDNADVRWEWYPNAGEVVSLAVFAKRFDAPIERVYRATSGTSVVTFVNAESAGNVGAELELRKRLDFVSPALETVTVFTNATLMRSTIEIPSSATSQTNAERPMVGQAPYVVNAGVTWMPDWRNSNVTLLYNVVGKRVVSAGEIPLPDVYELPRHVLDLSLRTTLSQDISMKVDVKNVLDSSYEQVQGGVVREAYRSGRAFSLGLSWRR